MRVVITGGGTGGHIYPGIAIAEALAERDAAIRVLFVGAGGLESRLVPLEGFDFRRVAVRPFPRRLSIAAPWAIAVTGFGMLQAIAILRQYRPQVVVATGGYAAAPVGSAAALLRVPLVVQEQNLHPGATNRILGRWACRVSVPHAAAAAHFPGKAVVTGVPVRRRALGGDRGRGLRRFGLEEGRLTVLVLGGSQGARSLNAVTVELVGLLAGGQVQILHQTGKNHEEWVRTRIREAGPPAVRYVAVAYIDDIADAYVCADVVICRAGAGTLAEVTAHGLPAILIPYPFAARGHQEANARVLEAAGAAVVVLDRDLTAWRLADDVHALRADPGRLPAMAAASRRLGRPDAAREVAALVTAAGSRRAEESS